MSATHEGKRRVVLFVASGATLLDVTGPVQVFSNAMSNGELAYDPVVVSMDGGLLETDTGLCIQSEPAASIDVGSIDTLLVSACEAELDRTLAPRAAEWLLAAAASARRYGSTCIGAFIAAEAGLLDGKTVATHWRWCDLFQSRHPGIQVEPDKIFVKDGRVWTSAGVTSGIDLALAMVEEDLGRSSALDVAKALVVFLKRPGGQSQFSATLRTQINDGDGAFSTLHAWVTARLHEKLSVERLAEFAGMSPRTFARRYHAETGNTPARTVERLRVERAQQLLETTSIPISEIAHQTGLESYQRLGLVFARHFGVSPSEYRDRFSRIDKGAA